ncbi:MAG: isoleucine--tRNA ligase [Pirellulales bacterium]|nr:isoleucine--tRNA ligase [Pirellulales bacterium]
MFNPVRSNVRFPELEEQVLKFWDSREIYEKSLQARANAEKFVFYEGPPTANGLPHPGHCLTRAMKDLFPRYKTMRGFRCERKGGWDTHGLPVEVEVCKELGIHSKEEIEDFGVEPFIHRCMESVFRYTREWENLTKRLGFWIHLEDAYVTYHQSYVESVWWSLKTLFDRGLLFQGHKIVWWWAQGGTALSSGEVGQGYRTVDDPSVYVRFPLLDDAGEESDTDLLVWTTTPWTLPSNQFAAVHSDLDYAVVRDEELGRKLIVATALVEQIAGKAKRELTVESTLKGSELVGRRYRPPFDYYYKDQGQTQGELIAGGKQHVAWRVLAADFVTIDSGTGLVHEAPAFGEVDHDLLMSEQTRFQAGEGPHLICAVGPDGKFTQQASDFADRWVKEADKDICRNLRERGLLFLQEQYRHEYPFCWRADQDPLIQYPRKSWFIRTTAFKDSMLANNAKINWLPEHIREGRFGNFLEANVDWALSRERYWGTPLPIWRCQETGKMEAIGSYEELLAKPGVSGLEAWEQSKERHPNISEHLKVHKPYVDEITYDSPYAPGAHMRRVPDVIDCWYDSGAMPFAQWGYPHTGKEQFADQFPADFISEALDQTRGWFYSQLAISTLLFGDQSQDDPQRGTLKTEYPHPYRTCIVLGLMNTEWYESPDGERYLTEDECRAKHADKYTKRVGKMSKQLRNYPEPNQIFDKYGADALRWFFFANQPPWTSIVYSERSIKEVIPEFMLRLWNVYNFFVEYARIDNFNPAEELGANEAELGSYQLDGNQLVCGATARNWEDRNELDRWIISELNRTAAGVVAKMDAYENFNAAALLKEFLDALSNWYVRRSRDRFWSNEESQEKCDAYWTLYECLLTTAKLIAPFTPFIAEELWQNLACAPFGQRTRESVHLCDYPTGNTSLVDNELSERMALVREIVSLGRAARMNASLKVRQPLSEIDVVLADRTHLDWLREQDGLIRQELNVKAIDYPRAADDYISYTVTPNFPRLGPRLGKQLPQVKKALADADPATLLKQLEAAGKFVLATDGGEVELNSEDVQVRLNAREGWAAAQGSGMVVVLNTELNPELIAEGHARDIIRAVQDHRKELKLEYTDRIHVGLVTDTEEIRDAVEQFRDYIMQETLALRIDFESIENTEPTTVKIAGSDVTISIQVAVEAG